MAGAARLYDRERAISLAAHIREAQMNPRIGDRRHPGRRIFHLSQLRVRSGGDDRGDPERFEQHDQVFHRRVGDFLTARLLERRDRIDDHALGAVLFDQRFDGQEVLVRDHDSGGEGFHVQQARANRAVQIEPHRMDIDQHFLRRFVEADEEAGLAGAEARLQECCGQRRFRRARQAGDEGRRAGSVTPKQHRVEAFDAGGESRVQILRQRARSRGGMQHANALVGNRIGVCPAVVRGPAQLDDGQRPACEFAEHRLAQLDDAVRRILRQAEIAREVLFVVGSFDRQQGRQLDVGQPIEHAQDLAAPVRRPLGKREKRVDAIDR